MKKILVISLFPLSVFVSGQVAIGRQSVASHSVSLDFGTENRGIILPWVTAAAGVVLPANGSIIYDLTDYKVKVKYMAGWKDLSGNSAGTTIDPETGMEGNTLQITETENTNAKTTIGTLNTISGILVLEDTHKAMVLPKVANPHLNIINPAPGMLVYDTASKMLAVFNGKVWSFWKQ
ncbi:hypothetical protein [Chryseobacterium herbae]|uniref:Uncharacterized protein n=1 Tax=Chryseobacterium herbae TaxID=2976476 RepID=A0ABT2INL9_9FLAO|nr:hypothetical protein [Chryseobacterium sp. pc1-10]MCT2560413.1 hypothetical protein [Chryseobacterium sp. pc1-10]